MLGGSVRMYKLKHVYICDHCNAVALPYYYEGFASRPNGWGVIGDKIHLCSKCYKAYIQLTEENEGYHEDCD